MRKALEGATAVFAADVASGYLPGALDVAGLPVRKAAAAVGGTYAFRLATGASKSLTSVAISGIAALAAAELATRFAPVSLTFGPFDAVRLAAGAAGSWGASKLT